MTARCPCCGQECADLPRLDSMIVALGLTGDLKSIFMILSASRGRFLRAREIAEVLWMDDANGGPEYSDKNIHVRVKELRALLASYPVDIEIKNAEAHRWQAARIVRRWTIPTALRGGYALVPETRAA